MLTSAVPQCHCVPVFCTSLWSCTCHGMLVEPFVGGRGEGPVTLGHLINLVTLRH